MSSLRLDPARRFVTTAVRVWCLHTWRVFHARASIHREIPVMHVTNRERHGLVVDRYYVREVSDQLPIL